MKKLFLLSILMCVALVGCGKKEVVKEESKELLPEVSYIKDEEVVVSTEKKDGVQEDMKVEQEEVKTETMKLETDVVDNDLLLSHYIDVFSYCYDGDNLVISPYSIEAAMAMLGLGLNGEDLRTFEEAYDTKIKTMASQIALLDIAYNGKEEFKSANSIWTKDKLKDSYIEQALEYFDAEVVDDEDKVTVDNINKWVSNKTDNMIDSILSDGAEFDTALLNACAFQGTWESGYNGDYLEAEDFIDIKGRPNHREYMYFDESSDNLIQSDKAIGCIKDYEDGNFSFVVILPDENIDFNKYCTEFNLDEYNKLMYSRGSFDTPIDLYLPRFTTDFSVDLKGYLEHKKLGYLLQPGADFTNLTTTTAYITDILHKAFIDVDKDGTKAAAVTAITITNDSLSIMPEIERITIDLNRPFMYMIVEKDTSLPLFMGVVTKLDSLE